MSFSLDTGPFNSKLPDHYLQPRSLQLSPRHPHLAVSQPLQLSISQVVLFAESQAQCLTPVAPPSLPTHILSAPEIWSFTSHIPLLLPAPCCNSSRGPHRVPFAGSEPPSWPPTPSHTSHKSSLHAAVRFSHESGPPLPCLESSTGCSLP